MPGHNHCPGRVTLPTAHALLSQDIGLRLWLLIIGRFRLSALVPTAGNHRRRGRHTPARALLIHRQVRFAQGLHARPKDRESPEEILTREGAALAPRLRAAVPLRPGDTVETQEWGAGGPFPGQIAVESSEGVGAACAWRTPGGWTGRRFHLGTNKEVFGAEVCAIRRALGIAEEGRRYTIFVSSCLIYLIPHTPSLWTPPWPLRSGQTASGPVKASP